MFVVDFADFPIFHFAQRKQVERTRHGAVAVIGDDDQVGRLLETEFDELVLELAEQFGWDATSKGQLQLFRQVLAANSPPRAMQMARAG